jgi:hypothetical protein
MASVSLELREFPDATLDLTAGVYTLTITGLTGLTERPRDLTVEEERYGVVAVNPPTAATTQKEYLPLILLRAIEIGLDVDMSLLEDEEANGRTVYSKHQQLLAQLTRISSRALMLLEPPS